MKQREEPKTKIEGPTMNPEANTPTLPRYLKTEIGLKGKKMR